MRRAWFAVLSVLCGSALAGWADAPKPTDKGKTDPPGVPVEALLSSKQASYPLDLGDKTADDYR